MNTPDISSQHTTPLMCEVQGLLLLGMLQSCLSLRIIAESEINELMRDVVPLEWYPASRLKAIESMIRSYYDDPSAVLEQAGANFIGTWYHQVGAEIVRNGVDFLRFQAGSSGYTSVVRGNPDEIGNFELLELDESTGRAVIRSTTPFSRDFERGVIRGGMQAPGELDYVSVRQEPDTSRFSVFFRAAGPRDRADRWQLPDPADWDPHRASLQDIDSLYWHCLRVCDEEERTRVFADATGQCLMRMAEELKLMLASSRELEHQLFQSQKLESMGTLAGGIAHDFNNILQIITGYASMLRADTSNPSLTREATETILKTSSRGAQLVRQLLTIANKTPFTREPVLLNEVITEVATLLKGTFPKSVTVETDLEPHLSSIGADSGQLHQAILNICLNAQDAMPHGGCLTISTRTIDGADLPHKIDLAPANRYVLLSIGDTGSGMDKETLSRIFEPFFTTKEVGKGSGLGLALVNSIVQGYGGKVEVESIVGRGSTFHIYLPATSLPVALSSRNEETAVGTSGGTETILVIDDEKPLRDLWRDVLKSGGYSVLSAADGREAVETYRRNSDKIDVVVCDMGIPHLSGLEVHRQLKETNPDVRFILASGNVDPHTVRKIMKEGAAEVLHKPFHPAILLEVLRKVLDAGTDS